MHLDRKTHGSKQPAVVFVATHPAAIELKNIFDQTLHRLDGEGSRSFFLNPMGKDTRAAWRNGVILAAKAVAKRDLAMAEYL
ncbi:MAG: hypothetical protein Q8R76_01275 [Candidatus Omnitrophota bacterium]|nr:hypothetical protein [Candidatus Omnitrophota bacterium]